MDDPIAAKVYKLVAEKLAIDESAIRPESRSIEDLNTDSLDIAEMVMKVEEDFGVSIRDEDAANLRTVGDVIAFLHGKNGDAAPTAA